MGVSSQAGTFILMQLDLTLNPLPKSTRAHLSPELKGIRKEKSDAHRAFKLLKSNRFRDFSTEQVRLLEKYYHIKL